MCVATGVDGWWWRRKTLDVGGACYIQENQPKNLYIKPDKEGRENWGVWSGRNQPRLTIRCATVCNSRNHVIMPSPGLTLFTSKNILKIGGTCERKALFSSSGLILSPCRAVRILTVNLIFAVKFPVVIRIRKSDWPPRNPDHLNLCFPSRSPSLLVKEAEKPSLQVMSHFLPSLNTRLVG